MFGEQIKAKIDWKVNIDDQSGIFMPLSRLVCPTNLIVLGTEQIDREHHSGLP